MKTLSKICAAFLLIASPSIAFADDCTGTTDVSDLDVGCGDEASRVVSIAKCDFRSGKTPTITITSVTDGRGSAVDAVVVGDAVAGNFNVTIRPKPANGWYNGWNNSNNNNNDNNNDGQFCKVQNFSWVAE